MNAGDWPRRRLRAGRGKKAGRMVPADAQTATRFSKKMLDRMACGAMAA
jgi:hypothetical protein